MIQIIPIDQLNLIKSLELQEIFITSTILIYELCNYNDFPINLNKSIYNILRFLCWCDNKIDYKKSTLIQIPKEIFINFFTTKHYLKYEKILTKLGVCFRYKYNDGLFYDEKTHRCLQFKFNTKYIDAMPALILMDDNNDGNILKCDIDINEKYKETIKNIEIDYMSAIKDEIEYCDNDMNKLRIRLSMLFYVKSKRSITQGINNNRISHSFSNISKISRKHLSINNKKFYNIDITNCQPLLLCYYLLSNNLEIDKEYIYDCEVGTFYENFIGLEANFIHYDKKEQKSKSIHKILERNDVKIESYKSIFFEFNTNNPLNKEFAILYPKTHRSLSKLQGLACKLQQIEASIFNNIIPLSDNYFTLYDAIYFTDKKDISYLYKYLITEFEKLNIKISIKIE